MFQVFIISGWIDSGAFPGQGGSFINPPNMTSTFTFFQETVMRGVEVGVAGGGRVVAGVQSRQRFQEKKKERNRTQHLVPSNIATAVRMIRSFLDHFFW